MKTMKQVLSLAMVLLLWGTSINFSLTASAEENDIAEMAEINQTDESDESVETETLEVMESLDDKALPDIPKTTEEAVEETDESKAGDVAENGERAEVRETSVSDTILAEESTVEKTEEEKLSEDTDLKVAFAQEAEVDGVCISVKADEGVFPEGATLSVAKVYGSDLQAVEAAVEEERADDKNKVESYTFDIKVLDVDGNEIEPDNSQGQVKVSFTLAEVANANLETDVYHVKGEVGDLSVDKLEATETSTTVEAVTDGFSFYTVEFTYNNLQYVMNGDTTVALAEILNHVGLQGTVTNAVSDAPELFSVENTDSGWMVTAHEAFTNEQRLTVTIDGRDYVIVVTDDEAITNYAIWVGGVQVTSANASNIDGNNKVNYNAETNTLTLNGYTYEGDGCCPPNTGNTYGGIHASVDLKIEIVGKNSIKCTNTLGAGILTNNNLIISGTGELEVYGSIAAILSWGGITINGGNINASGYNGIQANYDLIINGGNIEANGTGYDGKGISSSFCDVQINDGEIVASSDGEGGFGIRAAYDKTIDICGGVVIASGNRIAIAPSVKNVIEGIGWTDCEGTEGMTSITINTEGQELTYRRVQFPANADEEPTDEESSRGNADSIIVIPDGVETSVSGDKPTINGLDTKASELAKENGKDVTLNLVVTPKGQSKATQSEVLKQNEDIHTNVKNQFKDEESVLVDVLDISIEQFINGAPAANLSEPGVVVEIGISYNFEGKYDPTIVRKHNGSSSIFNEYSSRPSSGYQDACFFIDRANNMLYIYSDKFSDYVIAYSTAEGNAQNRTSVATGGSETASTISYPKTVPVYRLFNANSGQHFYTANKEEHDILVTKGWNDEGIAWQVRPTTAKPIYRLFDKFGTGNHLFTSDAAIRDSYIAKGWADEGIAWYAEAANGRVVYKLTKDDYELLTTSAAEKDVLATAGFTASEADFKVN